MKVRCYARNKCITLHMSSPRDLHAIIFLHIKIILTRLNNYSMALFTYFVIGTGFGLSMRWIWWWVMIFGLCMMCFLCFGNTSFIIYFPKYSYPQHRSSQGTMDLLWVYWCIHFFIDSGSATTWRIGGAWELPLAWCATSLTHTTLLNKSKIKWRYCLLSPSLDPITLYYILDFWEFLDK